MGKNRKKVVFWQRTPLYTEDGKVLPVRAPGQDRLVPDYSNEIIPIFPPVTLPELARRDEEPGERANDPVLNEPQHTLNLSTEMQKYIYNMCQMSGVDYFLVLAIIAHETDSKPESGNASGTQGLMQFSENNKVDYQPYDKNGNAGQNYLNYSAVRQIIDHAQENGANLNDLHDPLTSVAYGISTYYVFYQMSAENAEGVPRLQWALWKYGGGDTVDDHIVREIVYYRNLLAEACGEKTWNFGLELEWEVNADEVL